MNYLQKPPVRIFEPQQDPNDLRVKHIIMPGPSDQPADIGVLGVPFDEAVILGGGRSGARFAPSAVRKALKRYGTTFNIEREIDISDLKIIDIGDITVTDDINETHQRITSVVNDLLLQGTFPLVIGGGHDISIGTIRALSTRHSHAIGGINIDAHFDVREIIDGTVTSGTPFRKLLDAGLLDGEHFIELGAHDNLNAKVYYDYLVSTGTSVFTLSDIDEMGTPAVMESALRMAGANERPVFVSIDIDSVAQCHAPGSSAPDARGFSPRQIRDMAFMAGASKAVQLLDIVEFNPEYDVDERTALLVASIIISFFNGFTRRRNAYYGQTHVL